MVEKPTLVKSVEDVTPIAKPDTGFSLDKFKSKRPASVANVETLQTALPHHTIAQAKDFVRLRMKNLIGHPSCASSTCRLKDRKTKHCT
jgi:hypothetical protein